jgi:mRNA interferase MazF
MSRGSVWWVRFDKAEGGEISKTRPAIIISNNRAARALNRVQVVPLTSSIQRVYQGEALVTLNGKTSKALATQLTTVTKLKLQRKIGELDLADMACVEEAVREQLDL